MDAACVSAEGYPIMIPHSGYLGSPLVILGSAVKELL